MPKMTLAKWKKQHLPGSSAPKMTLAKWKKLYLPGSGTPKMTLAKWKKLYLPGSCTPKHPWQNGKNSICQGHARLNTPGKMEKTVFTRVGHA